MATPNLYGLTGGCSNSLVKPVAPVDFTATADEALNKIVLAWDITDADYERLTVEVSEDEVTWTPLGGELMPDVETITHEDLDWETEYFYRMRCRKRFKWSDYSTADDTTVAEGE